MAHNFIFHHINKIDELLRQFCSTSDDVIFTVLPTFGSGELKRYKRANWDLYIGHFKLNEDIRIQRLADPDNKGEYGISFQTITDKLVSDEWQNLPIKKASEGLILNSHNASIDTLWHRNTECSMVHWSFNDEWIKEIEESMGFPKSIGEMLEERENPMFHVPLSTEMQHNIRQMLYPPSEIASDFTFAYMYGKCIELFTRASGLMVQRMNQQQSKYHIHPDDSDMLERVKVQLINDYQTPPTMNDLVKMTSMSKSKLQRLFQATYKSSVYQFIKNIRLEKAMELLMQGHSVTEAGYDVGYSSIPNFSTAFKEHFSLLPGQVHSR